MFYKSVIPWPVAQVRLSWPLQERFHLANYHEISFFAPELPIFAGKHESPIPLRKELPELALMVSLTWRWSSELDMVNNRGRDSGNGQFIPIDKAKKNPGTTTVETIPPPTHTLSNHDAG